MNEQPPKKKHTWIWVVLGVFVLLGVLFIGAIAGAVMFFRQNFDVTENISASNATNEFDAVYKRFPGQQPLIQMVDGKPQLVAERVLDNGIGQSVTTLHVLAFDSDDEEMAKVSLPFWLLRMKSGPIRLSAYADGWDDRGVAVRVEEIERHGPGIIADVKRDEGRLLIWAE